MAFQQSTRQAATQRVFRPTSEQENSHILPQQSSQPVEESQTWVLFSPATDVATTSSYLTCTQKSDITPGRSQVSDIGSFNTPARSDFSAGQHRPTALIDAVDEDDDDAELDSLDSHLAEFRSNPNLLSSPQTTQHNVPVVPAHDGLGSFRLDQEGMGSDIQDRLYAFEQYNPRRVKRRRESLDLAQAQFQDEEAQQMDKMRRIEAWRLEQSRLLLEEIQKETRRRRRSNATRSSVHPMNRTESTAFGVEDQEDHENDWHDQNAGDPDTPRESIWGRITRKVVRDILGIDDNILAVLFGETLPEEEELSSTPKVSAHQSAQQQRSTLMEDAADPNWQLRMLERVAKELGLLIHQLSDHPGAFSTFNRVQQMPIPYAGLPSIPEVMSDARKSEIMNDASMSTPEFRPTVGTQTLPMDVTQRQASHNSAHTGAQEPVETFTQEEWEQDLDIRLVFRYLRSRFMPRFSSTGGVSGSSHISSPSSSSMQDAAAKVARVRQHHPLVARSRPVERRNFKAAAPSNPALFRSASSCASQSTRRSRRRSSGSSRHYWDVGGSVGTGSLIATTNPMGSWGEV